jgi:hypothetical protein
MAQRQHAPDEAAAAATTPDGDVIPADAPADPHQHGTAGEPDASPSISSRSQAERGGSYRGLRARITRLRTRLAARWARVDEPTRLLCLAMGLPLVDGVFASLVLSDALSAPSALIVTGCTVFGGPWMLTVVVGEMAGEPVRRRLARVVGVSALVIPAAGLEALVAPTVASLLHLGVFQAFSALIVLTVGAMIANGNLAARLPAPRWLVVLGVITSVAANLLVGPAISPVITVDVALLGRAMTAAGLAAGLAVGAAVAGPTLDAWLDLEAFRTGSGLALALVPFSIAGILPGLASLAVFGLAAVFALDV